MFLTHLNVNYEPTKPAGTDKAWALAVKQISGALVVCPRCAVRAKKPFRASTRLK